MEKKRFKYIVVFCSFIVGAALIVIAYIEKDDHIVIDTETVSTAERSRVYSKTQINEFKPGDTLSSKENGAWTLWDSTMIRELQVAFVTDSGTIQILR